MPLLDATEDSDPTTEVRSYVADEQTDVSVLSVHERCWIVRVQSEIGLIAHLSRAAVIR